MKELFGQRLREQRIKHGLTLEQLAEKSELSSNYIGMVERGLKEPGLATIVKLLNALNISADTLLCDLVPSASHVTDDEIRKRLEGLTKNGELGHGKERAVAIADVLDTHVGAQDETIVWEALRAAAQEPNPEDITSNTQWSVVFDNTEPAAAITLRRHWGDVDAFAL